MELDDDDIPALVAGGDSDQVPDALDSKVEEMTLLKVPITIVTGTTSSLQFLSWRQMVLETYSDLLASFRSFIGFLSFRRLL
jgi:hypothetical protein